MEFAKLGLFTSLYWGSMSTFIQCYDHIYGTLQSPPYPRDTRKKYMVALLNRTISQHSKRSGLDIETLAVMMVYSLVSHHENNNFCCGESCLNGCTHHYLYVAMKLAYVTQLEDKATITKLLLNMYRCKNTFEKLFIGAVVGERVPQLYADWKTDWTCQHENAKAVFYFLNRANQFSLKFGTPNPRCFLDVPIKFYTSSLLKLTSHFGQIDKVQMLLKHGASVINDYDEENTAEYLIRRILRLRHDRGTYSASLIICLRWVLRTIPSIQIHKFTKNKQQDRGRFLTLVKDGVLPRNRCGIDPPQLKHLARCAVRKRMAENCKLPFGIQHLDIPRTLKPYLNICED